MAVCYFTIVTRNYLVYADALYESLQQVSPDSKFYCLVVDAIKKEDREILEKARFEIIYPVDAEIRNFSEMIIYYDAFELCNALKAATMKHLLFKIGFDSAIYLDSDILVYNSFEPILASMNRASFGFTPHFVAPLPSDGRVPNELTFLRSGIFNGGVWIFNRTDQSRSVLDWLINVSEVYAFNDQSRGMFVDQKLICQAAGIFNNCFFAINDVGCNVAYWNLHERVIELVDEEYYANSQPLVCFHYSGYKQDDIFLSSHSDRFKYIAKENEGINKLLATYCNLLTNSNLSFSRKIPYRFQEINGVKLDAIVRRYYFKNRKIYISFFNKLRLKIIFRLRAWVDTL